MTGKCPGGQGAEAGLERGGQGAEGGSAGAERGGQGTERGRQGAMSLCGRAVAERALPAECRRIQKNHPSEGRGEAFQTEGVACTRALGWESLWIWGYDGLASEESVWVWRYSWGFVSRARRARERESVLRENPAHMVLGKQWG